MVLKSLFKDNLANTIKTAASCVLYNSTPHHSTTGTPCLKEGQVGTENRSASKNGVTSFVDSFEGQLLTHVPDQMSDTVEGVEYKGEGHGSFGADLDHEGQRSKSRDQCRGIERYTQDGRGGVSHC